MPVPATVDGREPADLSVGSELAASARALIAV